MRGWTNIPGKPLKEKLDIVEIVDFIWGFLGRKVFQASKVASWLEGEGDHLRDWYLTLHESEAEEWGFFVRSVIPFLRPPRNIQLLLSSWSPSPSDWNYDRPGFLRQLGVFDTWCGVLVDNRQQPMSDNWITFDIVIYNTISSFSLMGTAKEIKERWDSYRDVQWPTKMRGNLFFRRTAEREFLHKITGAGE